MASSLEFVQYAAEQMREAGNITYRKMFGEYGVYCDGKIFALICDNQLFIKITKAGEEVGIGLELEKVPPYEGAKPYYLIEDLEERERLTEFVIATCKELPVPKPKKKKTRTSEIKESENKISKEKVEKRKMGKPMTEKLDYKKKYKDLYLPKAKPMMIEVPEMTFIQVEGKGNPNTSQAYKNAMEILYGLSYGIKMSKMSGEQPQGYFEYVVPPLEGLWWVEDTEFDGKNVTDKDKFCWISMIRQPEFVTEEVFAWAKENLKKKKPELDFSDVSLVTWTEGLCAQVMHTGPYDEEPETIEKLEQFIGESGYVMDIGNGRYHHEIYLGDPRKTKPERLRTVIRHPIRKANHDKA